MTTAGPAVPVGGEVVVGPALPVGGASAGPGVIVVPATPGGGQSYEHVQDEPSTAWIVDHNLGRYPVAWSLYDHDGHLRDEYIVEHPTVNRALVRTDVPCVGRIRMI